MKKKKGIIPLAIFVVVVIFVIGFAHRFIFNIFSGRVQFPEAHVGENLKMEDGKKFTVLRRLEVKRENDSAKEYAVFKVRFKFKSLTLKTNKQLSMIPAPFLIGMEGFSEKYWTFDEQTGYFQGIYQWESKEIAEKYPDSFIFKLMTKRAAPGTLSYEIIPNTDLSQYIKELSSK
jgi:hypothetical protein